jgi:NDP-sugar pyrophosphorylase family protein
VLNGDVLTDADLSAMRAFHEAHGSRTTILLRSVPEPRQYGLVETDAEGRLRRFREKPGPDEPIATDTINAGVYLIDAALLARIPARQVVSVEREVFPALIAEGVPCYGFTTEGYWRDIGSPAAYRAAQIDLLAGQVKTPLAPPGELREGCWIEPSAFVATGARLEAPAVIGAEVAVQVGARIGPSTVLGERARIGRGARVEGAVLWERVEVGEGSVLRDCVVGADVRIGADVDIAPGVVLESGAVVPDHTRLAALPR